VTPSARSVPPWLVPACVLSIAALLRLVFVLSMGNYYYFADTAEYEATAMRLLHGLGPAAGSPRAPLFPAVLALGFLVGGAKNYVAARFIQIVLGVLMVAVFMKIAERIAGRPAAILTGLGLAFAPTLVFVTGMLYPTTLYTLILAAITLVALDLSERPTLARGAALGALLQLGWLTDRVMLAPMLAVSLWLLLGLGRGGMALVRALGAAVIVAALFLAPGWLTPKPASSQPAVFMEKAQYVLFYSRTDSSLANERDVTFPPGSVYQPLSTRAFARQELGLFRRQPLAYLHDISGEFVHFFKPMPDRVQTRNQYTSKRVLWIGAIYFLPVLLLSIWGFVRGGARWRHRTLLAGIVLATGLFYSFFFTQTRYRIPVEPHMIALAALGLLSLVPGLGPAIGNGDRPGPAARG